MTIRSPDKDAAGANVLATRPDDMKPGAVTLKARGPTTTASIKVGTDGEEAYSRIISKRSSARLKGKQVKVCIDIFVDRGRDLGNISSFPLREQQLPSFFFVPNGPRSFSR